MNRVSLINKLFSETNWTSYLEIGCYKGNTFFNINSPIKIGVDPNFHRNFYLEFLRTVVRNPSKIRSIRYFRETSDIFFEKRTAMLVKQGVLDVIFIDGLHTFQASLNDLVNALKYLNDNGVIVMHDCFPPHAAAATPSEYFPTPEEAESIEGWTGAWCGDVWKTIAYVKHNFANELDVWVLNTDNGLGVIKPKPNSNFRNLELLDAELARFDTMTYNNLASNSQELINLKETSEFEMVINKLINIQ